MKDLLGNTRRALVCPFTLVSCVALFLSACGSPPDLAVSLESPRVVRVSLEKEWRDALDVPAGEVRLELGRIPKGGVLRLGVLPVQQGGVLVEVRAGGSKAAQIKAEDPEHWRDARIELGRYAWFGDRDCTLVCRSPKGVRLGPCELVKPDANVRNVLIVLLDTVRWDHLSCYGYPEKTSPAIDRLADEGVRFYRLMPQASWTRPSVASLLTSTYPSTHGAEGDCDSVRAGLPDLAEALNRQGYVSLGVVANPNCLPLWGIGNTFTRYVSFYSEAENLKQSNDAKAVEAAIEGIAGLAGRPWFVYLHLMAAHRPYTAPEAYADRFRPDHFVGTRPQRRIQNDLVCYDGEIACVDQQVGRLMEALRQAGLYENTLVILLSDHGEQFFEHGGQGHGVSLYDEELRVPFIVKLPGGGYPGDSRQALVEMVDVAPTILELLGLQPEPRFSGRSFADIVHRDRWEDRAGFASLRLNGQDKRAIKSRLAKCIVDGVAGCTYWFDLEKDRAEAQPSCFPAANAAHLEEVATRMTIRGAPGVHLLIRPGPSPKGTLRVHVNAPDLASFALDCPGACGQAFATAHGVEATVDLAALAQPPEALTRARSGWMPYAHLLVRFETQIPVSVRVERDGEPLADDRVFIGPDAHHACLDGTALQSQDLVCHPLRPPLPNDADFAVGLWTVSPSASVVPDALSEDVAEALGALGYFD